MTIFFDKDTEEPVDFDYEELIRKVVEQVLQSEHCPFSCEVNLTLTTNENIRSLNQEYRQLDVPTDVLSFPMAEYETPGDFSKFSSEDRKGMYFNMETGDFLLGDIVISLERAKEQAEEYGHSLEREIAFLTAHSMLHLLGYDHIEDEERERMEEKQERILQELGITRD